MKIKSSVKAGGLVVGTLLSAGLTQGTAAGSGGESKTS